MQRARYQVFVSSTFIDLEQVRQHVFQAILGVDCIPAGMEWFPGGPKDKWETIQEVLSESDYYVVIVGNRYGSRTAAGISFTEKEYDYALAHLPMLAYLPKRPKPAGKSPVAPEDVAALADFCDRIKKRFPGNERYWANPSDLTTQLGRDLVELMKARPRAGWARGQTVQDANDAELIAGKIDAIDEGLRQCHGTLQAVETCITNIVTARAEVSDYASMLRFKAALNAVYRATADGLLQPALDILSDLANARLRVAETAIAKTFALLLSAVDDRYDGVSKDDLTFWEQEGQEYLKKHFAIAAHRTTTRLFILPVSAIREKREALVSLLRKHMRARVGWAIVLLEDVPPTDNALDYGLFDRGKAVSFFRLQNGRKFDVTFYTNGHRPRNDVEIDTQLDVYSMLVSNCLIASTTYAKTYIGVDDPHDREILAKAKRPRREQIEELGFRCDDDIFPLVVDNVGDLGTKLDELLAMHAALGERS